MPTVAVQTADNPPQDNVYANDKLIGVLNETDDGTSNYTVFINNLPIPNNEDGDSPNVYVGDNPAPGK